MNEALKPYFARSAGAHAALLVAFILYTPTLKKKADKVYMIDFVGGPTVMQSAAPAEAPAEKDSGPAEPAKATQQAEQDTYATKKHRAVALPRPSLLSGWSRSSAPPRPSMAQGTSMSAAAAGPAAGMPGDAAGIETDMPNFPYPWYITQVRQMLWAAWQKRMPAATGEGVVVFAIVRNGAFTDLRMESSSGDQAFDEAAIEAVQAAAPFPALPSDFSEPFLKIHLTLKSEASWR
ncbi:MAG: TonB C-terminal domain-containing protein [Elusimicrobiota bacterium]|nr:MAG: TonB C-terminal domain-containing protein [Elusimicrobiota bacterium]